MAGSKCQLQVAPLGTERPVCCARTGEFAYGGESNMLGREQVGLVFVRGSQGTQQNKGGQMISGGICASNEKNSWVGRVQDQEATINQAVYQYIMILITNQLTN